MSPVEVGNMAEVRFVYDALAQGLHPCTPWSGQSGFDIVLAEPHRSFRVQVKVCTGKIYGASRRFPAVGLYGSYLSTGRSKRRKYSPGEFDVLAVWIRSENAWVFLTTEQIRGRVTISLPPSIPRNRWDLFRG
jgi:hypothetical protein